MAAWAIQSRTWFKLPTEVRRLRRSRTLNMLDMERSSSILAATEAGIDLSNEMHSLGFEAVEKAVEIEGGH